MKEYNRKEQLKTVHQKKKDATLQSVKQAICKLNDLCKPITFASVAYESGIARPTLYRNEEVRTLIEEHRDGATHNLKEIEQLRKQLMNLQSENEELKDKINQSQN